MSDDTKTNDMVFGYTREAQAKLSPEDQSVIEYWRMRFEELHAEAESIGTAYIKAAEYKDSLEEMVSPGLNSVIQKATEAAVMRAQTQTMLQGCHTIEEHLCMELASLAEQMFITGMFTAAEFGTPTGFIFGPSLSQGEFERTREEQVNRTAETLREAFLNDIGDGQSEADKPTPGFYM